MYCLDTDILISYLRGIPAVRKRCAEERLKGTPLFTTFINVCELYKGAVAGRDAEKEIREIVELLNTVQPLNMNNTSCLFFGKEWNRLQKAGTPTQNADLMIASVAIANNLTIISGNKKHYENIQGLAIEAW